MKYKLKAGTLFLPLLMFLSLSGLFLVFSLSKRQEGVIVSIDKSSADSLSLSKHMGDPQSWTTYTDTTYNYQIKYPPVWKEDGSDKNKKDALTRLKASLSSKVQLTVLVRKAGNIPQSAKTIKLGDKNYFLIEDRDDVISAITRQNDLYYQIGLSQRNYFENPLEFKVTFFRILKSFSPVSKNNINEMEK
ncbi:MAG: hypothetical protein UU34_C0029G0007 [Candidatus Curtissbacteria bacterium GW2011_GWA1_41_11]|uniref:Uncharacterized protein n=1 Tax=Candidatus Curtissbacteria bacterium GW2011_GWA1_41_11 TaxID=1618409 RepID=A0A0G0UA39_9BACT|nr:MAG: hypothetical protein UU34_C0029G0007 [Candidatus Curtissbacteria bacterium GW2011_GWA1_41_11]